MLYVFVLQTEQKTLINAVERVNIITHHFAELKKFVKLTHSPILSST